MINTAWTTAMCKGFWNLFDEQMTKCTVLFAKGIRWYTPMKPIRYSK